MWRTFLVLLLIVGFFNGFSQTNSRDQKGDSLTVKLDSVIVFGSANQGQRALVSAHLLQGTNPNLIDALDHLPGIFKIHDTGYPLVYRGMHSNRLRIERNGVLKTGVVDQGYLVDDINPENIQDIKIVKGIERILFGSGAIGGVVQINEADASKKRPNSAFVNYSSNNRGKAVGLVLGKHQERFGIRFSGRRNDAENFSLPGGEAVLNSGYHQNNLALSTFLTNRSKSFNGVWNHNFSSGLLERPQGFQNNPFELRSFHNLHNYQTDFQTKIQLTNKAILEQRIWGLFVKTDQNRENYNATFDAINVLENRVYQKEAVGYRVNLEFSPNSAWSIRTGGDFIGSWLEEQSTIQDFLNQVFDDITTANRIEKMFGLYSMAKHKRGNITIGVAIRADLASVGNEDELLNFNALTGGLELEWHNSSQLKNIISLSRQFRYPSQQEAIGVLFGGRGVFRGNPEIKPEFSHQLEWNMIGYKGNWEYNIETWLAHFNNRITEVFLGGSDYTYQNIDKARTFGIEGRIAHQWAEWLGNDEIKISLSGSFIQGDNLGEEGLFAKGEPLIGIPSGRMRLGIDYNKILSGKTSLASAINVDRVSALNRFPSGAIRQTWGVLQTDAYWLAEVKLEVTWQLGSNQLTAGFTITNLTNTNYFPFGARVMGMGRNINSYLRFSF